MAPVLWKDVCPWISDLPVEEPLWALAAEPVTLQAERNPSFEVLVEYIERAEHEIELRKIFPLVELVPSAEGLTLSRRSATALQDKGLWDKDAIMRSDLSSLLSLGFGRREAREVIEGLAMTSIFSVIFSDLRSPQPPEENAEGSVPLLGEDHGKEEEYAMKRTGFVGGSRVTDGEWSHGPTQEQGTPLLG